MFRILRILSYSVFFGIIGLVIGVVLANWLVSRSIDPFRIEWAYITTVPTTPKEILSADLGNIYLLAENQDLFQCRKSIGEDACKPVGEHEVAEDQLQPSDCMPIVEIPEPPGIVLDRYDYMNCFADGRVQITYALLDDGSIWEWRYDSKPLSGLLFIVCPMITIVIALVPGIILGLRSLEAMDRKQS